MTRPLISLVLLGLAAGAAAAQGPPCTYDTCALRLRHRFFSGVSLVEGARARQVARIGLFAPHVDVLETGSDSTKYHFQQFRSRQNGGAVALLVGAVAVGVAAGFAHDQASYESHKTEFWSFIGVGFVFTIWGGAKVTSANDHLQRSIWFYNRDLPR